MKSFRQTLAMPSVLFLAALSWSGCLHLEQEIRFKDGNSGNFRTRLAIPLTLYQTLSGSEEILNSDPLLGIFNPQIGSLIYSEINGVKLTQYRTFERGGNFNVLIEGEIIDFQSVSRSRILGNVLMKENEKGTYTFEMNSPSVAPLRSESTGKNPGEPIKKEELLKSINGLKMAVLVEVPEKIITSSASIVEGKIARWVFDPEVDDTFLSTFPEINVEFGL